MQTFYTKLFPAQNIPQTISLLLHITVNQIEKNSPPKKTQIISSSFVTFQLD